MLSLLKHHWFEDAIIFTASVVFCEFVLIVSYAIQYLKANLLIYIVIKIIYLFDWTDRNNKTKQNTESELKIKDNVYISLFSSYFLKILEIKFFRKIFWDKRNDLYKSKIFWLNAIL